MRYTLTKNISQKEKITNWPKRGKRGWCSVTGKDELTRVSDDSEFERILDEYQLGGTSDKTNFVSPINFHIPGILIEKQNLMNETFFFDEWNYSLTMQCIAFGIRIVDVLVTWKSKMIFWQVFVTSGTGTLDGGGVRMIIPIFGLVPRRHKQKRARINWPPGLSDQCKLGWCQRDEKERQTEENLDIWISNN